MLMMPRSASSIASIMAFDPGTDNLGVAEIRFDVETLELVNVAAKTLVASRHTRNFWSNDVHGDRFGRINWLEDEVVDLLFLCQPFQIAVESPFFNRMRPNAFEPLIQIKFALQRAVARYTAWKSLYEIDPPTVKKAVGAKGNADKHVVREAVLKLNLPFTGPVPIENLDEHSIDAIAVGLARFEQMLGELCLR